jgi:5,10-methylenetetrahydrofolate reductase
MLIDSTDFSTIVEVNPPELPSMTHLALDGGWDHVLITDNVFGKIRVSPYAFAARITHDVPKVHPTVVVSTRDRNILAIESEVRGALGNGVDSFLVVVGDTYPHVDHLANHYEIVRHLRELQEATTPFEVGMPTRFRSWQFRKRIDLGAQFFVTGPVIDPVTIERQAAELGREAGDPPVFLMLVPPFSSTWVEKAERFGCVPATDDLKRRLVDVDRPAARAFAWEQAALAAKEAEAAGFAGVVLTSVKFETAVGEGAAWRRGLG